MVAMVSEAADFPPVSGIFAICRARQSRQVVAECDASVVFRAKGRKFARRAKQKASRWVLC